MVAHFTHMSLAYGGQLANKNSRTLRHGKTVATQKKVLDLEGSKAYLHSK